MKRPANWFVQFLRESEEKNQMVDDLESLAVLVVFAVGMMALLWLDAL